MTPDPAGDLRQGVSAPVHAALDMAETIRPIWTRQGRDALRSELEIAALAPQSHADCIRIIALAILLAEVTPKES